MKNIFSLPDHSGSSSHFITTENTRIHYIRHHGEGPPVVLIHGLTGNAHAFDGLIAAGLQKNYNVISVDLRGHGLSKHAPGYTIADHAQDIIDLLDHLGIQEALIGGHLLGGMIALYLTVYFPDRVKKLVLIDVAAKMRSDIRQMIEYDLSRLGVVFPSFDKYVERMRSAPYNTFWDDKMLSYYQADVRVLPDNSVTCYSLPFQVDATITSMLDGSWLTFIKTIKKPTLLLNATGIYAMNKPLLPEELALETRDQIHDCVYQQVEGNHQTMLYGNGARQIVDVLNDFFKADRTYKR